MSTSASQTPEDLAAVRREPDPIRRAQRASELLRIYEQRTAEIADVRRAAINDAHDIHGVSYTDIADALDLTKGRITQIRQSPAEHYAD